jgi:hypothetical protein
MTHIIYFKKEADNQIQRTTTDNKNIHSLWYRSCSNPVSDMNYRVQFLIQKQILTPNQIKWALNVYSPINELEYE